MRGNSHFKLSIHIPARFTVPIWYYTTQNNEVLSRIKTVKQAIHKHIKGEEPLFSEPAVANLLNSGLGTAAAAARGGWRRANYSRLQGPRRATSRPAGRHFCAKCIGLNHPLNQGKT